MTGITPQRTDVAILREVHLGRYYLLLMNDHSLDLMRSEGASHVADNVLSLDNCEAYRLMISLQEMFKEVRE